MEVTAFTVHWLGLHLPSKFWLRQGCGLSSEHTVKPGAGPGLEGVEALFPGSFYSAMSNKGTSNGQVASSKSLLYMQVQYTIACSTLKKTHLPNRPKTYTSQVDAKIKITLSTDIPVPNTI